MSCFAKLHGRRGGSGNITAILSHGFGTDQDAWSELLPWFQGRFDVITFDLAGCGPDGAKSYDFDHHSSMFGYADDLIDLMDELDLRDCLFVGHSMSGMVGAAAATARPELFARLVMIGASPRYLNDADYIGGFDQPDLDHLFEGMAANYQAWVAGFAPMVVGVDDSEAIADFSRTLFQMRPDVALATSRTIFGSDMRPTARRVSRPVHLIQTASDVAVPHEVGVWLGDAIQNTTLDIVDASGHLPRITAPGEVLRILERRLADIPS